MDDVNRTGSLAESMSSLGSGAFEQATKAAFDTAIGVCKRNLGRMVAQQSNVKTLLLSENRAF
jgi:hypothetical protein